jgi:hypothetical protein
VQFYADGHAQVVLNRRMSPILRTALVAALAAATLAGCGDRVPTDPAAKSTATPSATPTDTDVLTGDVPPSGGPRPSASRTSPVASVPSACGLVGEADLTAVTGGVVTLTFPSPPSEQSGTNVLTGASSTCRRPVRSSWTDSGGNTALGGTVVVVLQSGGADLYFPVRVGDPVTGLGDEAMSRGVRLYIRLGTGLLILEVGIGSPTPDPAATELAWAKQLAPIALHKLGR